MRQASRWVAIGLVSAAVLGCKREHRSSVDQVREGMGATRAAVQETVADAARRAQLLEYTDELEQLLVAQNEELEQGARQFQALNADPAAERSDFERTLERLTTSRRERRARALDVHFAMVELTTAEEWKQIAERERQALGPMLQLPEKED